MQFGNLWGAPKIFPPWKFAFKVVSGGFFLNDIKMSEVSFSSIRWHYLCRRRDCPSPQTVLWSLPRLYSVCQIRHPKHCCCFWIPLLCTRFFCWVFCLPSKHFVRSVDLNQLWFHSVLIKLDWAKQGSAPEERRQVWVLLMNRIAKGSSSGVLSTRQKRDGSVFITTSFWVQECCCTAQTTSMDSCLLLFVFFFSTLSSTEAFVLVAKWSGRQPQKHDPNIITTCALPPRGHLI